MTSSLLLIGCVADDRSLPPVPAEVSGPIGRAEMAPDGTLMVHFFASGPRLAFTQAVAPDSPYYSDWLARIGGIKPGDQKPIVRSVGRASMSDDGTITVEWNGGHYEGPLLVEPSTQTLKPGGPDYEEVIRRVGGLEPGQSKVIPPEQG